MLIGYTGFVGGTLLRQSDPDSWIKVNSKTGDAVGACEVEHLVCAGIDARKWLANKEPEADRKAIDQLFAWMGRVSAERATLISTVDVYGNPGAGLQEFDEPRPSHAYGENRLYAEQRFREMFPNNRILRLPALFGLGLRKNALFDLINEKGDTRPNTRLIHPHGSFQWYDMDRLSSDVEAAWSQPATLANLVTKPVPMHDIIKSFFPELEDVAGSNLPQDAPWPFYGVETIHGPAFGGGRWIEAPAQTRRRLAEFIARGTAGSKDISESTVEDFIRGRALS